MLFSYILLCELSQSYVTAYESVLIATTITVIFEEFRQVIQRTMVQNKVILTHEIIHFPMSLGVSEVSERANERSGVHK